MRTASFLAFGLALFALALGGGAGAQPPRGPALKPLEIYERFRATVGEGKYDVAGLFLDEFLKSGPTDADYLEIERKYGTTVFQTLRTIPKYSDDPATEKQIRANIELVNKNAQAVTAKVLYKPERVAKYVRNLGETYEEKQFAQLELKRTGEYAVPFLIDALRANPSKELAAGILDTIPVLEGPTMAGWVAALDVFTPDQQYGVLVSLARRRDVRDLLNNAQTDFVPFLWRVLSRPRSESSTLHDLAAQLHNELVPGPKADTKRPEVELTAFARKYYDHKGRYFGAKTNPDASAALVPVWVVQPGEVPRVVRLADVPVGQAEEYYGLRYARWALDVRPDYEPAQALILALAAERAVERAKYAPLAATEPAVYKLLSEAPSRALIELLSRGLAEKRTPLVLAMVQVLGDRADREAATPPAGTSPKPSLLVRALGYPDHSVQFAAASALLRSPVPVPPEAKVQIVEILRRAASFDGGKPGESKGTALLVDPGKFRADANASLLRGFGYDVEILGSGRDLLRRVARSSDFDLIFIDHHAANPELIELVGQLAADPRAAARPVFVIASPDKPRSPTFDQLLLRTAELLAATENDVLGLADPYVPDARYNADEQAKLRTEVQRRRDTVLRDAAKGRAARLQRVIDTLPIALSDSQKRLLNLRLLLVSYSVLAAEFAVSPESAPGTVGEMTRLRNQIAAQPPSAQYSATGLASSDLMKLIERFELDVAKVKGAQDKYDALRSKVDPVEIGLAVEPFRDPVLEARLSRLLKEYPEVKVITEPYSKLALEPEFKVLFADPMMVPREAPVKKAESRAAIEFLRQMAVGDLPGYDFKLAEAELRNAVDVPTDVDRASAAVDAVERLKSAAAQQSLLQLATRTIGEPPIGLRRKAADAAIRHVRAYGRLAPQASIDEVVREATPGTAKDSELLAKLLTLKGMLAYHAGNFANDLKNYNPPVLPPTPKKAPEQKEPEKKQPEKSDAPQ
ncbi:hypothetical protein GobsT_45260 [Gemmata obscuriglobus]|uniref:Response regulatory domain-containing protein n=1 Tax=Gemmata obscuriglobus TaxID=114 RepID=A0A2Z3GZM1_9BACT|nr:hypothetical protein [Gemmata obscuriglobus]AWM37502.1 hypothetical protein C1280_11060 [Gemmata obscuriglobus]QEG29728.1 hypothetical protein GobsT_45260 [Gemmata obscuriglobus]VTS09045.1 heat repeat-containing protein : HEAT repeat-containing protein OS=Singulisphaera acidiphila (strain ATCC BAA-1392 / DSM 18658 / VKM B-2454 / MOB10) GN=Sinac_0176 PE=4 SV=1 [Gemmata obscuriglobus UQM 2246]